ncbi:hypothetical protein L8G48_07410 [Idiomarina sp. ATCH4]|nr:hypothetical protein [Idiomarina sp. ATCH4]MCK7459430.1 hypothetical protein [Idiomarina sp. ATCH4]
MLNTVRCNDNVGGLPDSNSFLEQLSEIVRALYSHFLSEKLKYGKLLQNTLGNSVVFFMSKPLKYFREYPVANNNCAIAQGMIEKIGLCGVVTAAIPKAVHKRTQELYSKGERKSLLKMQNI